MSRIGGALVSVVISLSTYCVCQNPPPSDPQALALAAKAIAALTGGTPVQDATLTGKVTWVVGPTLQTGTATSYAKGTAESRIDMVLTGGNRSEIRNSSTGTPQGAWLDASGNSNAYAYQNCWTDANWFLPQLSSLLAVASDPSVVLTYIGQETRNKLSVLHIQSYRYVYSTATNATAFNQQISTMDYYLDPTSLLPIAIVFNAHPDDDASTNIPVEVDFANYQAVNGVQVPFHIQKLWQGDLLLDFTVANAALNTGLNDSLFTIQ